jgi:hypothetical protein
LLEENMHPRRHWGQEGLGWCPPNKTNHFKPPHIYIHIEISQNGK